MALNKKVIKTNGLATNYHRILHIYISYSNETVSASITMAGYIDEEYRLKEKNGETDSAIVTIENYDIELDVKNNLSFSDIYKKLKKLDIFADATDC